MSKTMLFFAALLSFVPLIGITATASDEPVVVVEEDWLLMTDTTPDQDFKSARESFIKRDWQTSAAAVRRAGAYLAVEAARAKTASADALRKSSADLKGLADKIKAGSESNAHALDEKFAAAQLALAAHYHDLANRAHAAKQDVNAGNYMHRAADSLKAAATWSGEKLETGATDVADAAKASGDALKNGGEWAATKTGELMTRLGASISSLGSSLQAKDKNKN